MGQIKFEDRTSESLEQKENRKAVDAGFMLAMAAHQVCDGDARLTLRALSAAVGLGVARTGAPLEEVLTLIRKYTESASERLAEQLAAQADQSHGKSIAGSSGN